MSDYIKLARLQNKMKSPVIALALGVTAPFGGLIYSGKVIESWIGIISLLLLAITGVIPDPLVLSMILIGTWVISAYLGTIAAKQFNVELIDEQELLDAVETMGDEHEDMSEKDKSLEISVSITATTDDEIEPLEGIKSFEDDEVIPEEGITAKVEEDVTPVDGIKASKD